MTTVLVIDDERAYVEVIAVILRDAGLRVVAFHDPKAALRVVRNRRLKPDVALVDQRMPAYSGTEFMHRLAALSRGVVGILATGYTDLEGFLRTRGSFFDYIAKPFRNEDLLFRIYRALVARSLRNDRIQCTVLPLEQFETCEPIVEATHEILQRCEAVLLSGGDGEALEPFPPRVGQMTFCHLGFLSSKGQKRLEELLANALPPTEVSRVPWKTWRDVAAYVSKEGRGIGG